MLLRRAEPGESKNSNPSRHSPWSSYAAMTGAAPCPEWLYTDWLLSQFGHGRTNACRRYEQFVLEGIGGLSPWGDLKGQVLLGTEAFVQYLLPLIDKKGSLNEIPKAQRLMHRPELKDIFTTKIRREKKLRDSGIRKAYLEFGYSMASIARELEIHYSTVSKIIRFC